jgi:hypothetical protein
MRSLLRRLKAFEDRLGENGSALLFALVLIAIIGIAGAALLKSQSTTFVALGAYSKGRDYKLGSADSAADAAIEELRTDPRAIVDGNPDPDLCNDSSGTKHVDPTGNGYQQIPGNFNGLTVWCKPAVGSGALPPGVAGPPANSMLTLGGQTTLPGDLSAAGATQLDGAPNPMFYRPFCDDFHDFQSGGGSDRWEAGLYVGRGVSDLDGGLVISWNGQPDPTNPVVISNSSIIGGLNHSGPRQLTVGGDIWARSYCAAGADYTSANWFPSAIIASGAKHCYNSNPTAQSSAMTLDPDYVHEPIDLSTAPHEGAAALNPLTLCPSGGTGYIEMPAAPILNASAQPTGYYQAIYDNVTALNTLMSSCYDTLFYFRPGVYYFDFRDANGLSTDWNTPAGNIPAANTISTSAIANEVLGGSPNGWNKCICNQPAKAMFAQKNTASPGSQWTNVARTALIDTQVGSGWGYTVGGNGQITLAQDQMDTPIPQRSGTTVNSVNFEIAYDASAPAANYKQPPDTPGKGAGVEVDLSIPSQGHCYVWLPLGTYLNTDDSGIQMHAVGPNEVINLDKGCDPTAPWFGGVSGGFPQSTSPGYPNTTYIATAPGDSVFKNNPLWVNQLKGTIIVAAATGTDVNHEATLNVDGMQMTVSWFGRPAPPFPNGCDNTQPGVQFIFGNTARMAFGENTGLAMYMELCANPQDQTPSPFAGQATTYPNRYGPVNYTTGTGHNLGIAIYGLSEDSAPPPVTMSSDPNPSPATTLTLQPSQVAVSDVSSSSHVTWTSTNASTANGPPNVNDILHIGDGPPGSCPGHPNGCYAYTIKPGGGQWTGNDSAQLQFTLQNLTCSDATAELCQLHNKIPPESVITNVQVQLSHAEGRSTPPVQRSHQRQTSRSARPPLAERP